MLDRPTREDFVRWLRDNADDILNQIPQHPRSMRDWAADFARAMRSETAEMGQDRGYAGIFGDHAGEDVRLTDPDADDEQDY